MSDLEEIEQRLDQILKTQERLLVNTDDLVGALAVLNPDNWIDSLKVKEILHISTSTLYRRCKRGDLQPRRLGGSYLFYAADIFKVRNHFLK